MTKNNKLIAGAAVLAAGVATFFIARNRRRRATMHAEPAHRPHSRHISGVFSKAKNYHAAEAAVS
ncbi:MAG: hypothetical protein EOO09_05890 [Chitinophagaceae bacterium]|nr:MAG: hypothetical protein EOO09_05890 [Chitinophagaceae bacterium]